MSSIENKHLGQNPGQDSVRWFGEGIGVLFVSNLSQFLKWEALPLEIPEFMIRGINCAILLFHPLKWKSPKNTKETMNEPGKTRDEA